MGWSGGTDLFINVWKEVREFIPDDKKVEVCAKVIDAFFQYDWDCVDESFDEFPEAAPAWDKLSEEKKY